MRHFKRLLQGLYVSFLLLFLFIFCYSIVQIYSFYPYNAIKSVLAIVTVYLIGAGYDWVRL